MPQIVIDTNVLAAANGKAEHASPVCVLACVDRLDTARKSDCVLLDDADLILAEYRRHLSMAGQPGAGDFFLKWLWTNQANPHCCRRVAIRQRSLDPGDFAEFPQDPELEKFDRSDRKFVAVAVASGSNPPILNATDTDWLQHKEALSRNGIHVDFLCPDLMKLRPRGEA